MKIEKNSKYLVRVALWYPGPSEKVKEVEAISQTDYEGDSGYIRIQVFDEEFKECFDQDTCIIPTENIVKAL